MVLIRLWKQKDLDYVTESVQREGWGHTQRDIARCWGSEPKGCFIAEIQKKPVGHVFSICYARMGWIGLLIVDPEKRGKGIGTILMRRAISYLQQAGVESIRLEGVPRAITLYKRLGFKEEFDSLRFSKTLQQKKKVSSHIEDVSLIHKEDLQNLAKFDSRYFGASRLRVLESLYRDQPQQCFVAKEDQKLSGYLMSRESSNAHWIGPWVCSNPSVAEKLFDACVNNVGYKEAAELWLGTPILNADGARLAKKIGFRTIGKSIRMVLGKRNCGGDACGIYGIGGPEKG